MIFPPGTFTQGKARQGHLDTSLIDGVSAVLFFKITDVLFRPFQTGQDVVGHFITRSTRTVRLIGVGVEHLINPRHITEAVDQLHIPESVEEISHRLPVFFLGSRHGRGFQSLQHDVDVIDPAEIPAVARRGRSYRLEGIGIISSRCTVGEVTGIPITIIYRRIAVVIGRGGNGGIVEDGIAWPHIGLGGLIGFESRHFTDGGSWSFIEKAVITSRKAYGQCGNGCIFCNLFHGSIVGFRV